MKLVTSHVYPPIPDRSHDWCAYVDGEEERQEEGWGKTEGEAIADYFYEYGDLWCRDCWEPLHKVDTIPIKEPHGEYLLSCCWCKGTNIEDIEYGS